MINKLSLTNLKPYAKIIAVVAALIFVTILITIIIAIAQKKSGYKSPTTIPDQIQPKKLTQTQNFESEISKLKPFLPYADPNYKIEFLEPVNALNVQISAKSQNEYINTKKQAENFIKSKNITNICTLNIFWVPIVSRDIRKTIQPTDLITTYCPVIPK